MVKLFNSCVRMIVPACRCIGHEEYYSQQAIITCDAKPTHRSELAILRVRDQGLIIGINIRYCDVSRAELPVVRVVFPDDRAQPEALRDGADAIVDVPKGWL